MADFLVEPVIEKLIDFGFEYLKDQVRWQTSLKEELESLRLKRPQIQAVVNYASNQEQIQDPALNEWLWQLRAAIDEADDVMDEFEYLKLKKQRLKTKKQRKVRRIMKSVNERFVKFGQRFLKKDPTLKRLEEVVHKLDKVSAGVTNFFQLAKEAKQDHQEQQLEQYTARETGCIPTNDQIGRGDKMESVMKWLRETSNEDQTTSSHMHKNISVLSIVGQGGMGKTTLLQHVYKQVKIDESDEREFDLKFWVCVTNNFNVTKVIEDMLESLTKERPRLHTLDALSKKLESEVKNKKFLLVLDDIWEEEEQQLNRSKWEKVLAPLASGKFGSKILVSTRMQSVALMLSKVIHKKEEILPLEGLKYDDCLQLFCASANIGNLNDHPNLICIAEKIVGKFYGSPLAARVIGGVIDSSLDEGLWRKVLDYHIGSQNDILRVLKLSYIFLPKVLRNCFSFCCTFPQDYKFAKDKLVRMWIALGFIQPPSNQAETTHDLGERYFDILVKKNLIDEFQTKYESTYKLHDLIHEMLRVVSAQECFSIECDIVDDEKLLLRNSKTIRHLFVKTSNIDVLRKVKEFKNLHSLHLTCNENSEDDVDVLAKIFKTSRNIRLMYINAPNLKRMPKEIGNLIHLRYLMIYSFKSTLIQLPKYMNNLLSLHYLEVPFPGIFEIQKLNSLKVLIEFYVQNKDGYRIEELEHMNELRILKIEFRENLKDAKDAYRAKLCDKKNLIDLSLSWHHYCTSDAGLHEKILDNLQPHSNLKKLEISNFNGVRPAKWLNNVDLISNLEHISLFLCNGWQTLPPFWQLPSLKYLYLSNMLYVKGFDYTFHRNDKVRVFPSLQILHINSLKALENLLVAKAAAYECLFPCLTELHLAYCPNLKELPSLPPKLQILEIRMCHLELMKRYQRDTGSNWHEIAHIPQVSITQINYFDN